MITGVRRESMLQLCLAIHTCGSIKRRILVPMDIKLTHCELYILLSLLSRGRLAPHSQRRLFILLQQMVFDERRLHYPVPHL